MSVRSSRAASRRQRHRLETRRAFDSVAGVYDGPVGNNGLVQRMRSVLWEEVETRVSPGARLLDLGCGTGLDAAYFGRRGYDVVATDWSSEMVARTRRRCRQEDSSHRVTVEQLGMHELADLRCAPFRAIYSNLGAFNCVADLSSVASNCARLLQPDGFLIASVIGRVCPWEIIYYLLQGRFERIRVRYKVGPVPVPLNDRTVWTHYYTPREFYEPFAAQFRQTHLQALNLLLPPPYLLRFYERFPRIWRKIEQLERSVASLPGIRSIGDHFLIVLTKRHDR